MFFELKHLDNAVPHACLQLLASSHTHELYGDSGGRNPANMDSTQEILKKGEYGTPAPYSNHRALAESIFSELRPPVKIAD